MKTVLIEFGLADVGDLPSCKDRLAAVAASISARAQTGEIDHIFLRILPQAGTGFNGNDPAEMRNALLSTYAQLYSHAMDLFPSSKFDILINNSSTSFKSNQEPVVVSGPAGTASFRFGEIISVANEDQEAVQPRFPERKYNRVCMGGTFDRLHQGHKMMLMCAAMATSSKVIIGVADGDLLKNKKFKELLEPFELRRSNVESFCKMQNASLDWYIFSLTDPWGPAITDPEIEAIVVSPETASGADSINQKRQEAGMTRLDILTIPIIEAPPSLRAINNDAKISSTTLRQRDFEKQK